ncbi:hypothetical protein CDL12_24755 [Handroanthus impetiginosus]|uniref:Uncharacterized protein n=1 Tax=Handroanthus impetiginosus TaxID=429701 RepID=A0A2G9GBR4_9LAMI|nr:hypothetical protein CDL12_24755 [Handroanthus impetiginosus]
MSSSMWVFRNNMTPPWAVCFGDQAWPCNLRSHLMRENFNLPTSLEETSSSLAIVSLDVIGESSSSGIARHDEVDSFRAL